MQLGEIDPPAQRDEISGGQMTFLEYRSTSIPPGTCYCESNMHPSARGTVTRKRRGTRHAIVHASDRREMAPTEIMAPYGDSAPAVE